MYLMENYLNMLRTNMSGYTLSIMIVFILLKKYEAPVYITFLGSLAIIFVLSIIFYVGEILYG